MMSAFPKVEKFRGIDLASVRSSMALLPDTVNIRPDPNSARSTM
jgi:hypothetical protein